MDPAYYVAAGSLKARVFQLDLVSNNLANCATIGYKPERSFFAVFNKAKDEGRGLALTPYVDDGTVLAQSGMDFSQGTLRKAPGASWTWPSRATASSSSRPPRGPGPPGTAGCRWAQMASSRPCDGAPLMGKTAGPSRSTRRRER